MSDIDEEDGLESIAIIGMAGRFPKSKSVKEFWSNIKNGQDCIDRFTVEETECPPDQDDFDENSIFVGAKGLLDDVDLFDAQFWGYTPKEVSLMDPQQRIFLECAWHAMEDAGYDIDRCEESVGVFAGCYLDTYLLSNLCTDPEFLAKLIRSIQVGNLQTELGNDKDYIATRTAFKMNLTGPAINVQCACSTSLVAITLACQSILNYQCDMALAGGVTITLPQKKGYFHTEGGMLSRDGDCRAFDADASGTVFSNAGATILLKRGSDAIADGDHIYAFIKGFATNNDGGEKHSFTAPSVKGQAEVITLAQAVAGVNARTIGYIEAHGTATPLGDPIEVSGLTQAFRETTDDKQFCVLGSVKTNIGHLDVASGVTGVIKTALSLHEKVIPGTLHFKNPNPKIDFENSPFYVNTALKEWHKEEWPRRAGVSSFGVGGTNAHVVMEEMQGGQVSADTESAKLILLSARSKQALTNYANNIGQHLQGSDQRISDIAYTSQVGRKQFEHRACVIASEADHFIKQLENFEAAGPNYKHSNSDDAGVVFMFPGQGSQFPGMASQLYEKFDLFRKYFDSCCEILKIHVGLDLKESVFLSEDVEKIKQTILAQPAIFAIEYSLAKLLMDWGIKPQALIGHSVGEYCAACIAGVLSLEDALLAVAKRGEYMQATPTEGAMLSVRAPVTELRGLLSNDVSLAAVNAPELCVLSGNTEAINAIKTQLESSEIACSILHTSHAFHSYMMDDAIQPTIEILKDMEFSPPKIPIMSTVNGAWLSDDEAVNVEYWAKNLRATVCFSEAITQLLDTGSNLFIEVGPGQTLSTLAKQTAKTHDVTPVAISCLGHAQSDQNDDEVLLTAIGRLWLEGLQVDWRLIQTVDSRRVPMPGYPFERKRYWVEPNKNTPTSIASNELEPDELTEIINKQLQVLSQQIDVLKS